MVRKSFHCHPTWFQPVEANGWFFFWFFTKVAARLSCGGGEGAQSSCLGVGCGWGNHGQIVLLDRQKGGSRSESHRDLGYASGKCFQRKDASCVEDLSGDPGQPGILMIHEAPKVRAQSVGTVEHTQWYRVNRAVLGVEIIRDWKSPSLLACLWPWIVTCPICKWRADKILPTLRGCFTSK